MEQQPEKIKRVERLTEMPEDWRLLREKILENFESKTDGLNIDRVKDFMKERGLSIKDFIVFGDEDLPRLREIFKPSGLLKKFFDNGEMGANITELGLALVRLTSEQEKNNDVIFTESVLVHELTHNSNKHLEYIKKERSVYSPRSGFALTHMGREGISAWGWFLEEGFSDMLRGEYINQYILPETRKAMIQSLKTSDTPLENVTFHLKEATGTTYDVGAEYLYFREGGGARWAPSAVAATGLKMLCKKKPELRQALIEARSDISKLREVPKLINAVKPGLYEEIQRCDYSDKEFARVQNIIKEAIQNSK